MDINTETFDYRMKSLEQQIAEINSKIDKLTDALTQAKLSDNDTQKDILILQDRLSKVEDTQREHTKQIQDINTAPVKKDAARWQAILDYIFKSLMSVIMLMVLAKMGLSAK